MLQSLLGTVAFYHEFAFLIYWRFIDLILIDDFSEK